MRRVVITGKRVDFEDAMDLLVTAEECLSTVVGQANRLELNARERGWLKRSLDYLHEAQLSLDGYDED